MQEGGPPAVQENTVYFWDETETRVLSLYVWACTAENVELALKDAREPQPIGFEPFLPSE